MLSSLKNIIGAALNEKRARKRKKMLAGQIDLNEVRHLQVQVKYNHQWLGSSYGGFYIHPDILSKESIIYSFGIGKDITFDQSCIKKFGCHVYGFDPTPKSINWVATQKPDSHFHFYDYGIGMETGEQEFFMPANPKWVSGSLVTHTAIDKASSVKVQMKSFVDIVKELGHTKVDVLKMDIEGAEYEILRKILDSGVPVKQILVEFHDRLFDTSGGFRSEAIVKKMNEKGYKIFAASESFEEISFIYEG